VRFHSSRRWPVVIDGRAPSGGDDESWAALLRSGCGGAQDRALSPCAAAAR
jgi:hypothetical protein